MKFERAETQKEFATPWLIPFSALFITPLLTAYGSVWQL
jgi:hypothetical protein